MKQLERLVELLITTDNCWLTRFDSNINSIEYNCTVQKTVDVVCLFEFRNSRNTNKIKKEKIQNIISEIEFSDDEFVLIHHVETLDNQRAFIYTNQTCNKILGVLEYSGDSSD